MKVFNGLQGLLNFVNIYLNIQEELVKQVSAPLECLTYL